MFEWTLTLAWALFISLFWESTKNRFTTVSLKDTRNAFLLHDAVVKSNPRLSSESFALLRYFP